jgi:hypothetical protein
MQWLDPILDILPSDSGVQSFARPVGLVLLR